MSIYSRDYMRDDGPRGTSGGPRTWSVVTWLLIINIAVYVLQHLIFYSPNANRNFLAMSIEALTSWRLWTPLTYQFSHANLLHLLGNMLGLFFLGRMLLQLTNARHLLRIYLLGGFAGGALQLLYNLAIGPDGPMVGASASVLAIVIAVATMIPHQSIHFLLFFIIPIRVTMRQVAIILIVVNALTLLLDLFGPAGGSGDRIAAMAHFGGMGLGWLYIRQGLHQRSAGGSRRRGKRNPRPQGRRNRRSTGTPLGERFGIKILRDGEKADEAKAGASEAGGDPFVNVDVDTILDKINAHGFQSLTDEEKRVLEQSSRRLSKRLDRDS